MGEIPQFLKRKIPHSNRWHEKFRWFTWQYQIGDGSIILEFFRTILFAKKVIIYKKKKKCNVVYERWATGGPARNTFPCRRMAAQPDTLLDDFQISVTNGSLRQRIIAEDAAAGNVRTPSSAGAFLSRNYYIRLVFKIKKNYSINWFQIILLFVLNLS